MTRTNVAIDLSIVVGSYGAAVVLAFLWNLIKAPAKMDYEKTKVIEAAQRIIGAPGSLVRDVFDTCAQIREFVCDFSAQHGGVRF